MIKALIFDVGGVLLRTEDLSPRRKWEARLGLEEWGLAAAVFENPVAKAATLGRTTEAGVWEAVRERFGLSSQDLAELRRDFWAGDRFDEALLSWIGSRRGRYRTGILSNAWYGARTFLTGQPQVKAAFDTLVISAEEGLRKPQPEIYMRTLRRMQVTASESVFVDDVLENVEAARGLGLQAILFKPDLDLSGEMARVGVA
jgi:putative hydrolase of the HAD superfamily